MLRRVCSVVALSLCVSACGAQDVPIGTAQSTSAVTTAPTGAVQVAPNAALVDTSLSTVQTAPRVEKSYAQSSPPLAKLPDTPPAPEYDHEVRRIPRAPFTPRVPYQPVNDPFVQTQLPIVSMPLTIVNFLAQGTTNSPTTETGDPPDTNGFVGPNHFVQTVNGGIEIWNKTGTVLAASKKVNTLWTGYTCTNNGCSCSTRNDGDPVVLYDQIADRWVITQFSLPNQTKNAGPSFQCVAVSKTGDPTGAYWLYDFKYSGAVNDYGKFAVWPDAYYGTFNLFGTATYLGAEICAYDRVSMLAGAAATQQCFFKAYPTQPACPATQAFTVYAVLPANLDGHIMPPVGSPGIFMQMDQSQCSAPFTQLDLWTAHIDWTTPANSTLTGPTALTVSGFTPTCNGVTNCIPQQGTTSTLDSLADKSMFRFNYRNFGAYQSLLVNHSVVAGGAGGVRWYEVRYANGSPSLFQQGTFAPADGRWRWMGSIAQDQAQDFALGYGLSSSTQHPAIGWTGRINTDAVNTMGQAESILDTGAASGVDDYGTGRTRFGDYSNMSVDPSDDCTFYYTAHAFKTNVGGGWDTYIASTKFANCGANDFSFTVTPSPQNVAQNGTVSYAVATTLTKGVAETIALSIQDLPTGVTGVFNPTSVVAGGSSTLTLSAAPTAPVTASPDTFTVIGKATSVVHAATAQVNVVACAPITSCPAGFNCGTIANGCGGLLSCGGTCTPSDQCHVASCVSNVCSNTVAPNGTTCNDGNACTTGDVCTGGVCGGTAVTCTASDQCHVAGTCNPATGLCSNPAAPNGTTCNDGSACTTGDVCTGGVCGGTAVTCTASDQCHVAGTCNPATGLCSNPAAPNGTTCNDGNNCTTGDVCTGGACAGTAVTCTASDQCHVAGTCNPATGACSNPTAPNGTTCNDGNACTTGDVCTGGTCVGTGVTCTASDQCHVAGTCNPATGTCSNPAAPNGTTCNDGNACTTGDVCTAGTCGGTAVTCTASDQCHVAGTCNPATGTCSNPTAPNGTTCNDGNNCTTGDVCTGGACGGTAVTCTASDQCHVAGTCNPATGACSNPTAPNGTTCNDGNACTTSDVCTGGTCGGTAVTCTASDQCHVAGTCNPATGTCSNPAAPNGTTCNDGNSCTTTDVCTGGTCAGTAVTCTASDQCHVAGTCNPATGACSNPTAPNGTTCSDGNACTTGDVCTNGTCGGVGVTCVASDQCHVAGTCNPATGMCSNPAVPNGTTCNDGNLCTTGDVCTSGTCGGTAVTCTASDQCHAVGTCNPTTGTCSNPTAANGTACSDGNACTMGDSCQNGACMSGGMVTCAAGDECNTAATCTPATGCGPVMPKPDGTACSTGTCKAGVCTSPMTAPDMAGMGGSGGGGGGGGAGGGGGGGGGVGGAGGGGGGGAGGGGGGGGGAAGSGGGGGGDGSPGGKGGCSCDLGHDAPMPSPLLLAIGGLFLLRVRRRSRQRF
jgi:hypothetical protein